MCLTTGALSARACGGTAAQPTMQGAVVALAAIGNL